MTPEGWIATIQFGGSVAFIGAMGWLLLKYGDR